MSHPRQRPWGKTTGGGEQHLRYHTPGDPKGVGGFQRFLVTLGLLGHPLKLFFLDVSQIHVFCQNGAHMRVPELTTPRISSKSQPGPFGTSFGDKHARKKSLFLLPEFAGLLVDFGVDPYVVYRSVSLSWYGRCSHGHIIPRLEQKSYKRIHKWMKVTFSEHLPSKEIANITAAKPVDREFIRDI